MRIEEWDVFCYQHKDTKKFLNFEYISYDKGYVFISWVDTFDELNKYANTDANNPPQTTGIFENTITVKATRTYWHTDIDIF